MSAPQCAIFVRALAATVPAHCCIRNRNGILEVSAETKQKSTRATRIRRGCYTQEAQKQRVKELAQRVLG